MPPATPNVSSTTPIRGRSGRSASRGDRGGTSPVGAAGVEQTAGSTVLAELDEMETMAFDLLQAKAAERMR